VNFHGILKVLERLDIPFVEELNGWVRTRCPFAPFKHERGTDNKPGFGISIHDDDTSFYNCLACKSRGSLSTLPMQLAHYYDDPTLIEFGKQLQENEILGGSFEFGEWENAPIEKAAPTAVTNFPGERAFFASFKSALAYPATCRYLAKRSVSASTIIRCGLRADPQQKRILFPVYDQRTGRYAGCSGRTVLGPRGMAREEARGQRRNPRYNYPKIRDYGGLQKDRLLLGSLRAPRSSNFNGVIVVEGLFAYLAIQQLRPDLSSVALLGSALTPGKRQLLLENDRPVFWLTDNDKAGQACLYGTYDKEKDEFAHDQSGALYSLYGELAQFTMQYPEGKTDPDELTLSELNRMIEDAELWIK
jgi:hypothetical protein